jgi:hypothetical protein
MIAQGRLEARLGLHHSCNPQGLVQLVVDLEYP